MFNLIKQPKGLQAVVRDLTNFIGIGRHTAKDLLPQGKNHLLIQSIGLTSTTGDKSSS